MTLELGVALSSEEQAPETMVKLAVAAEDEGFGAVTISDHFHPWTRRQGNSPMVWPVLGAIAARTSRVRLGTAVTCPMYRIHPAVVAQAAATVAVMSHGRFFLGVGTGENLNEHVVGQPWPNHSTRLEQLEEAVAVMRELWSGEPCTSTGRWFTVDRAQLFTVPEEPVPVYMSAFGEKSLRAAAALADGLIGTSPDPDAAAQLDAMAGRRLPKVAYDKVCWGANEKACRARLHELWPTSGLPGPLNQELATVELFEKAVSLVTEEQAVGKTPCGPDPAPYVRLLEDYGKAGYDVVCLHQVGEEQLAFLRFLREEVQPQLAA